MTTIFWEKKACRVCGQRKRRQSLKSTSTYGSPDLDTRPSMPMRDAIGFWIEQCPRCGYCAPDIAEGSPQSAKIVATGPYRQQRHSGDFPDLANAFLCYSLIAEQDGDFEAAGWACLHAGWVCDDYGAMTVAQQCRRKAVAFFELAQHHQQEFASSPELEQAVIVDLQRRLGDFARAMAVCRNTLDCNVQGIDPTIISMLRFQEVLILRQDTKGHEISEAKENSDGTYT